MGTILSPKLTNFWPPCTKVLRINIGSNGTSSSSSTFSIITGLPYSMASAMTFMSSFNFATLASNAAAIALFSFKNVIVSAYSFSAAANFAFLGATTLATLSYKSMAIIH
uniref:Uncharacterized protein n=1 Tax=Glossina pallidipes TaxID=7398 RepID=A0A1B0AIE2_GLOPL